MLIATNEIVKTRLLQHMSLVFIGDLGSLGKKFVLFDPWGQGSFEGRENVKTNRTILCDLSICGTPGCFQYLNREFDFKKTPYESTATRHFFVKILKKGGVLLGIKVFKGIVELGRSNFLFDPGGWLKELIKFLCLDSLVVLNNIQYGFNRGWIIFLDVILLDTAQPVNKGLELVAFCVDKTIDVVFSWAPLLKDVSRLDDNGVKKSNSLAQKIKQQIDNGKFEDGTDSWNELEDVIITCSNSVDFKNFLLDSGMDLISVTSSELSPGITTKLYARYLNSLRPSPGGDGDLDSLMNVVLRKKLKIIPNDVRWGRQSDLVFSGLAGNFMRLSMLLEKGVNITVYNGQLDVICATKGTEAWVEKLKWEGLKTFFSIDRRTPVYCWNDKITRGFTKSYRTLHFYWVLKLATLNPSMNYVQHWTWWAESHTPLLLPNGGMILLTIVGEALKFNFEDTDVELAEITKFIAGVQEKNKLFSALVTYCGNAENGSNINNYMSSTYNMMETIKILLPLECI